MPDPGAKFLLPYGGSTTASHSVCACSTPGPRLRSGDSNKRQRGNLPKSITNLLRDWMANHLKHPYPTTEETQELVAETGLNFNQVSANALRAVAPTRLSQLGLQVSNWFINARRRHWHRMRQAAERKKKKEKKPPSRHSTTTSKTSENAQVGT